jgi:outer membrane biosynthesis protein TonB
MDLPIKVSFRLNAEGRVEKVNVTSRRASRFVADTCSRVLKSAKFPPIPPKVIAEQHHNWVDVDVTIGGS